MIEGRIVQEKPCQGLHFQDREVRRVDSSNIEDLRPFLEN